MLMPEEKRTKESKRTKDPTEPKELRLQYSTTFVAVVVLVDEVSSGMVEVQFSCIVSTS